MSAALSALSLAETRRALDVTVALGTAVALVAGARLAREAPPEGAPARSLPILLHPLTGFLLMCAALLVNQLLFNAYVLRVHHGDASFVARYVGSGWFALATGSAPVRWLAQHVPEGVARAVLPCTVLRVQAALELPFTLLAYFAVVALLDERVYLRLARGALAPLAAASFTATFCYVEMRLWNPWTVSDLWCRWLSCAAVVLLLLAQRRALRGRPATIAVRAGLPAILLLFAGGGAVAVLVLCMYDVALLYNLGHLGARLPLMTAATLVAVAAAVARPRLSTPAAPAPGLSLLSSALALFSAVFFVPSLSIRYAAPRASAALAALLLALFAGGGGLALGAGALRDGGAEPWRGVVSLGAALCAGVASVAFAWTRGFLEAPAGLPELSLLLAAVAMLVPAAVVARLMDAALSPRAREG